MVVETYNIQLKRNKQKAFFKKISLKVLFKTAVVLGAFRWSGRAFHSIGATADRNCKLTLYRRLDSDINPTISFS